MIKGIHISSSEIVFQKNDGKKNTLPQFIKNQIVTAKVLQLLPQGKAQLLVNNEKIIAKTGLLLKPGEEIQLKVLQEKDAVVLKLINPVQKMTTRQVSSLVRFFSKNESISDIIESKIPGVKELLHDMSLKSDKADERFLPKLMEKNGMAWESKIARILTNNTAASDIKSLLDIQLQQDMKGNILKELFHVDPGKSETMKMAASFSETIENFQLLNHQSSESGRFILPFPVFSDQEFSFGQLLINTGDKSGKNNQDADKLVQISFLLDMSRLGPLRADFSILKKKISGKFLLNDDKTCEYVKSMIPELLTRLSNIEYQVHKIDCYTAKREEIQQSSFIETLVKASDDSVLNIVV